MKYPFLIRSLTFFLGLSVFFFLSCKDDDEMIIPPPPEEGDKIELAEGWYIASDSFPASVFRSLYPEKVEGPNSSAQERSGFLGGYLYLSAGEYQIFEVVDSSINTTLGGETETIVDSESDCAFNNYLLVNLEQGEAKFIIPETGFYRLAFDQMTDELILHRLEDISLIGSALPGDPNTDLVLPGSVDGNGGSWTLDELELQEGSFRLRLNCRWRIDRRIDPNAGFDASNGYALFTHFGGSPDSLLPGFEGSDLVISAADSGEPYAAGIFKVELTWDPTQGFALNLTRTGSAGIDVPDGWYITESEKDPTLAGALLPETVEDEGFSSQPRAGFVGGYFYLSSSAYQLVQVEEVNGERQVTTTIGGTATTESDMASGCNYNDYTVVTAEVDGDPVTIASDGFYRVTYDQMTNELILYQIQEAGLIGGATPNGWGTDTPLNTDNIDAEGATWTLTDITLRQGEYKIRFNCRWELDRRINPPAGYDPSNGYVLYTNFGGSPNLLLPGNDGSNMVISAPGSGGPYEEGIFDIELNWEPVIGFELNMIRKGDAPPLTFDPDKYRFGILGSATANGWDEDRNMYYKGLVDDAHTWYAVVVFNSAGQFKFRTNDFWNFDLGGSLPLNGSEVMLQVGGANIQAPGAGAYYITLRTPDEGNTWLASMIPGGWSVIGIGSPSSSWEIDVPMNAQISLPGISEHTVTGFFSTGAWKFRAGEAWDYNLGGALDMPEPDGVNFSLPVGGMYKVTLRYDGENYMAEAEKL